MSPIRAEKSWTEHHEPTVFPERHSHPDATVLQEEISHHQHVEDEEEDGYRLSKEIMFFVAAVIVLATSGGLILGFGPMYSALVREGQWAELCHEKTDAGTTCPEQEVHLQYVFSTSFLCLSVANAFFGVFLDVAGPRLTSLVGLSLALIGNFVLAYGDSHTGTGSWIIIGYSLIGAGGMGSYLAAFQILQLFETQGFVCSALSSLFNCSGYIYMLLQVDGISRSGFFHIYGMIVGGCMILCFLLFPTNNIFEHRDSLVIPLLRLQKPRRVNPLTLVDAMKDELQRRDLWYFAAYFGWISLIFAFSGGAIPSILAKRAGADLESAALYTNILYPVLVNGTFIYSSLVGYVIDHYGFKVIFTSCLILVETFIILLLVPSLKIQILSFIVYAMAQACLYALQFAYIMICFPPALYGTLQAFMAIVSFLFGLLNYALNPWTQTYLEGDYTLVLLLLGIPTIGFYFFLHFIRSCEDQTVKYDEEGHPLPFSIPYSEERDQVMSVPMTERSKLI
ncbi:hypothetical protein Poli38472_011564 [Pythium oligandrum]|uniref:Uncharacterized protein n=1 Tax=Pythium oligandrum TaxID=41045 RepID=A0A8K1CKD9_PYTOL|nr:hypothetical protein Poli38472_011564 [Pythium oligandrum]|eukprot:TMW64684.1 hypothetical protein Poli38472_011564 [Pythium oligandrum]